MVSVIIPTYNYGRFLPDAIASVQQQEHGEVEIIVIDDGSTDDTRKTLSRTAGIRYVHQDNQGLSAARNHGLRLASGKYLQFLDADDLLGPGALRRRVDYLESHPDRSAVICRSGFFGYAYSAKPIKLHGEWATPRAQDVDLALYYFNIAPPHAFLVRRSAVEQNTLRFDPSLLACEDYDFWFRLAKATGVPGVIRDTWVYYRKHAASMSRSYLNQYKHDAKLCQRIRAVSAADCWLGPRPRADYLSAMFAASVLTGRRLWALDRRAFDEFAESHVLPLAEQLIEAHVAELATNAGRLYLARARLTLLRMGWSGQSIPPPVRERLLAATSASILRASALADCARTLISLRTLLRLGKLDLQCTALQTLSRFQARTAAHDAQPKP